MAGYKSNHSKKDEHGTPQIDNMLVTLDDAGILQNVDIELHESTEWLDVNSLFINSYGLNSNNSQWDDWDYFVHDLTFFLFNKEFFLKIKNYFVRVTLILFFIVKTGCTRSLY